MKHTGSLGCLAAAGFLLAGLGGALAQQSKIVIRTDYKFNGYVAPLALAVVSGNYKDAGLDVTLDQGQGSGTTIQTVASGADDFGLADAATLVLGVSAQNIPVKMLAVYTQTATMGLISRPGSDLSGSIAPIKGRVIISSAGVADLRLLSPALASAKLTTDDVQLQLVDANARVPLFLQTPGAYLTGFATGDLLRVRARMPDATYVPYSQFGVVAYGTGLIASDAKIAKNPDLVKKVVAATQKGWEAALKDPEAAVAASVKLFPDLDPAFLRAGLKIALEEQLHTPATRGHPIGWTDDGDWNKMLDVLKTYGNVKPKASSAYYTNRFIAE